MASKAELEKENEELKAQILKMQETQARGEIQKLEENNARFSQGENVYSAKINQNGHLTIQCADGFLHVSPISANAIALFQTKKAMF